jgi:hypothetical protein
MVIPPLQTSRQQYTATARGGPYVTFYVTAYADMKQSGVM